MIDPEKLEQQRLTIEAQRIEARKVIGAARLQAAKNALRAAQLEAVRLGIRRECSRGCGREIAKGMVNKSGVCQRCGRTEWQANERRTLRAVSP